MVFAILIAAVLATLAITFLVAAINSYEHKAIFGIIAAVFVLLFIFIPWNIHQVDTGEVAVVRNMGKIETYRTDGVYWDSWLTREYEYYDTKVQQITIQTPTYSKDSQTIDLSLTIQYQIVPSEVMEIATKYGSLAELENRIEAVALDTIKSVFSQYDADGVITNRASISTQITKAVEEVTKEGYYVTMNNIVLTNIDFTDDFEAAIALKVAAQQDALKAENEKQKAITEAEAAKEVAMKEADAALYKSEKDAEAIRVKAQAEADAEKIKTETMGKAIKALADELNISEAAAANVYLNNQWIATWDGDVPTVTGESAGYIYVPER